MIGTRPNLAFLISQRIVKLGPKNRIAVRTTVRYLKGTSDVKLRLIRDHFVLDGHCNAITPKGNEWSRTYYGLHVESWLGGRYHGIASANKPQQCHNGHSRGGVYGNHPYHKGRYLVEATSSGWEMHTRWSKINIQWQSNECINYKESKIPIT